MVRALLLALLLAPDAAAPPRRGVDLLPLVDPARDTVRGEWALEGRALVARRRLAAARVIVPYCAPEEYDLRMTVERIEGEDAFVVGLPGKETQFVHVLDGYTAEGKCLSGFEVLDGRVARDNESRRDGRLLPPGARAALLYSVRRDRVRVCVDGKCVLQWKGDLRRLSVRPDYRVAYPGVLFVGAWESTFRVTSMTLFPVAEEGIPLRRP
jgi:hypothetical protein